MDLDLRYLMKIARRWWWLLLLAPVLAGGSAFYASSQQTPLYSATVTLRINPPAGTNIDYSQLQVTQNLTETYRQLILMTPILDRVIAQLNLPYDDDELSERLTSSAVRDTQLMKVSVSDADPELAALIANTMGSVFIQYLGEQTNNQFVGTQELLNQQIADVQTQLSGLRTQIESLDTEANAADAAIQAQIDSLQQQEATLLQQQASLQMQAQALGLGLVSTQAQVTVSNPAQAPDVPYAPRTLFYTALAVFVGLMLAVGSIALLEYLDNTVRGDTDVQALTGAPLLTSINQIPKLEPGAHQVYVVSDSRGGPAEAVRLLRANLEFAAAAKPINRLAITSAGPSEGKSTVIANLGVVMAQAGYSTVIIDADLRKPTQHKIFSVTNGDGLTSLLTHPGQSWREVADRVAVPNLHLITSGPIPPNPSDLLSLDRFSTLLEGLEEDVDIVLIDTPPVLAVSDPLLIASKSDGVILLGRAGFTRRDRLEQAATALTQSGIRLVGVVLNQQTSQTSGYYYYYGDYGSSTGKMDQPVFTGATGGHLSSTD